MHTFIVLEAGATDDTRSFITYLGKDGYLNPPPEELKTITVRGNPLVISRDGIDVFTLGSLRSEDLKANPAVVAYLRDSCAKSAKWMYLSGHTGTYGYTGDMSTGLPAGQGHAHYTFDNGEFFLTDNGAGTYRETIDTAGILSSCIAVIVMGCAIMGNRHHLNNLQSTLAYGAQDRPVILGWADSCPTQIKLKDLVLKTFINKVKATAGLIDDIDLDSRDALVKLWGEVAVKVHPGLGACDKDQNVWKLRPVPGQIDKTKWSTA